MLLPIASFAKRCLALVVASVLYASAAQAVTVDLITNGDFETGDLSGWSTSANSGGETFEIDRGNRGHPALGGAYDVSFDPRYAGTASLTQYFDVPDQVLAATFSFTAQIGNTFFSTNSPLFQLSVFDSLNNVIYAAYSNSFNTVATPVSLDLSSLLQSNQGATLGLQFSFEPASGFVGFSSDVTLDDIAMLVETPATVPLPASVWMMLAGLGLFVALGWSRKARNGADIANCDGPIAA